MGHLTLTLLGPFQATLGGAPVRLLVSNMARALLAYLAVEADYPHPREILAALLWPEQPDREALAHLRHTLSDLRQALGEDDRGEPFLLASRETIHFNPAADYDLDVTTFARALGATAPPDILPLDHEAFDRLEQSVALYRGGFLEGLVLKSAPFEEWALIKREQLHWQAMSALQLLAAAHEAQGKYSQAQRYARRQLELQPWQEEAHRQLMRALALSGQRSAALAQYQSCVQRLAAELGVAPADETVALYQAIRDGKLPGPDGRRYAVQADHGGAAMDAAKRPSMPRRTSVAVFVSREAELAKLDRFLGTALAGQGCVAFVSGLAGSGKTALMARFSQQAMARHPNLVAAGGSCNAHAGSGDPYLPFREILQLLSGEIEAHRAGGSLSPEHARRLWALLPATAQALLTFGPDLVGTFVPGEPLMRRIQAFAPDGMARWERLEALARRPPGADRALASQADLFDQATQVLQAVAVQHPLLLLLDDLQWADKATLGLLFHLGRRLGGGRILVVGAYRRPTVALGAPSPAPTEVGGPAEQHPLQPLLHEFARDWGDIQVDLDEADGRAFVDAFLDTEPNRLDANFRETLYQHTGGNALFTIELLRGLQERGDLVQDETGRWKEGPALHWQRLPVRVEAVIAERLGRLPADCRELLRVASVEGEAFTADVLARVTGLGLPRVIHYLGETLSKQHRLVRGAHLLRREPGSHDLSCYRFAHILFQHYVYNHLDEVARAHLHRSVAEALEALRLEGEWGVQDPAAPARLAWQWEAAGESDKAAGYLLQAGSRAMQVLAHHEAVQHFRRCLALLSDLPASPERDRQELDVQLALGSALLTTEGMGSQGQIVAYRRAYELSNQLGERATLWPALHALASSSTARGQYENALELGEQLLTLAERAADPVVLALAHFTLGATLFSSGISLPRAREHLEEAIRWYDCDCNSQSRRFLTSLNVFDLGVNARAWLANVLWILGYLDQALQRSQQALDRAQQLDHLLSRVLALYAAGHAHLTRGEDQALWESVHVLERLVSGKHLLVGEVWVEVFSGWLLLRAGQVEEGLARLRQGSEAWQKTGAVFGTTAQLSLLAEAYLLAGRLEEGLEVVGRALALVERTGARPNQAELHRLRGALLWARGAQADGAQAEQCFKRAIELARAGEQKHWELRATVSLARLWAEQGRRAEAHQVLAEIYAWFSEGFDTLDLRAAKALLDTLS